MDEMAGAPRRLGVIAAVAAALMLLVAIGGWWFLVRDDAPEPANLETASETLDQEIDGQGEGATLADLEGAWTVDTSVGSFEEFSGTWAGYRVEEELAQVGLSTAVGRTPYVTGGMSVEGGQVTAVDIEVDVTTLQSDQDRRDSALATRGLETLAFPTATFSLGSPIPLPEDTGPGTVVAAPATGDLTIHGVTRAVTIDLEAHVSDGWVAVVGQAPIALTDFGIDPPTGFGVISIANDATLELQIFFTRE
jgi:polyisoprenoid-binding protein YceI